MSPNEVIKAFAAFLAMQNPEVEQKALAQYIYLSVSQDEEMKIRVRAAKATRK